MISTRRGKVIKALFDSPSAQELDVEVDGRIRRAVCYPSLTGPAAPGDEVLLNTTAVELALGSGGVDFVMAVSSRGEKPLAPGDGHIMKLNYTPLQFRVLSAEEPASPHHAAVAGFDSLRGTPVVCASLHSMVAPICAAASELSGGGLRVVYVMSDGAALPIAFSRTVRELREKRLIAGTVTYGNAFGGDMEAVNKFSALATAREGLKADLIVVSMGVGITGTGTRLGFSGMEQGEALNAAAALGGAPVACARICFSDPRERHRGVSHHTITALTVAAKPGALLPLPILDGEKMEFIRAQVDAARLREIHTVEEVETGRVFAAMEKHSLKVKSMGRGPDEIPEFFLACEAAAVAAVKQSAGRA